MASEKVSAEVNRSSGTVTLRVGDQNVVLAFIHAGKPTALKKEDGTVTPATYAHVYVIMRDGRAVDAVHRDRLLNDVNKAFENEQVAWHVPD